jgi:hypothetical protein
MEKILLKTKYVEVLLDDSIKLYTSVYLLPTEDMTDQEWKAQMIELKNLTEQLKPHFIIDDNTNRKYGYSPEIQKWTLNLFVKLWNEIGLKKYAQILPSEILGKLTSMQIEDLAVSDFEMKFEYKMCGDLKCALTWIKE